MLACVRVFGVCELTCVRVPVCVCVTLSMLPRCRHTVMLSEESVCACVRTCVCVEARARQ